LRARKTVGRSTTIDQELAKFSKQLESLADQVTGGKAALGKNGGPVRKALKHGAKPIRAAMKIGAPVGPPRRAHRSKRTGEMIPARQGGLLRDSIRTETFRKPKELLDANEGVLVRPNPKKAPHFHLVEFGTSKTAANPFMRNAFESQKDVAFKMIKLKMAIEIKAIAKKLRAKNR
jgi:HK97 gp10 family phage protein